MLYEILKTSKLGASFAPDMYTALWAQKLARDGEAKTLSGAPPLSFKANGAPLLDYLISGNTVQSGTPTPDNAIMPQGTGERTGNLLAVSKENQVIAVSANVSYHNLSITLETTAANSFVLLKIGKTELFKKNPLTISFDTNKGVAESRNCAFVYCDEDGSHRNQVGSEIGLNKRYTVPKNALERMPDDKILCFRFYKVETESLTYTNIMLNLGSTPLPYEPYGYKIPISSAGQTTPIYLGEVQTTRKIKKLVLTGEETFFRDKELTDSWRFCSLALISAKSNVSICSHFEYITSTGVNESDTIGFSLFSALQFGCRFPKAIANTVTEFKVFLATQYAAGTPVTVWYVLATPETTVVNEPLMKIGEYADTVSMEQAGVEIPTTRGTSTLDVLTDVKPSNVYLKYKEV